VFLESVPELASKLKEPNSTKERKLDAVVDDVTESVVLILAY